MDYVYFIVVLNNEECFYFQVGKQLKGDLACVTVFIFSHSSRNRVPLSPVFLGAEFFIMSWWLFRQCFMSHYGFIVYGFRV